MKYTHYIAFLLAILVTSCTSEEIIQTGNGSTNNHLIQFVSRTIPFNQHDVDSRATAEEEVTMLDFIIFGNDGKCVYYKHGVNQTISIDRTTDFNGIDSNNLTSCSIAVLANYPGLYNKIVTEAGGEDKVDNYIKNTIIGQKGTDFFRTITMDVQPTVDVPNTGLPRIGNLPSSQNESYFDFSENAPAGTTYEVPLTSLYAKMVFDITVDPTEAPVPGLAVPGNTFQLQSYTVHNLAKTLDMIPGTESAEGKTDGTNDHVDVYNDDEYDNGIQGNLENVDCTADKNVAFTFYLPERYLPASTAANDYEYPFGKGEGIRPEDEKLRQRYKPLIANENATYVTFTGVFTNHQGHTYNVNYKIYVGNDNYSNFDIVRNRQYNNNITIKGIHNSDDQSSNSNAVSIDHRVNIERTLPMILSLRRETLLDAHFEVRPLRIRANMNDELNANEVVRKNSSVKVEVLNVNGTGPIPSWIRLERSYGVGTNAEGEDIYCTTGSASGKRKYFTYDLVDPTFSKKNTSTDEPYPLHNSTSVVVPLSSTTDCVWIYVDECVMASTDLKAMRSAMVRVTYGTGNKNNFEPYPDMQPIDYIMNQHYLYEVRTTRKELNDGKVYTYYIEHEEEYLHNFDSEDSYKDENNQTKDEGMEWGLEGIQLSHLHNAIYITANPLSGLGALFEYFGAKDTETLCNNALEENNVNPKYDFYLGRDTQNNKLKIRDFSGYTFNTEIALFLRSNFANDNDITTKIEEITLEETPKSAFAYCYNRNKRDKNGNVLSQDWYMPAIDEIEDIMEHAHSSFDDFHGKLYWSCQPAYDMHNLDFEYWNKTSILGSYKKGDNIKGVYYLDNTNRARATRAVYENNVFKDIISSATDISGTQKGELKVVTSFIAPSSDFTLGEYSSNGILNYDKYEGNQLRNKKARVRAVRRITTNQQ